ncbi:hypothetical protein OU995_01420 [Roseateles sp. SL47]|uniref:hypothetical protein n=1 Tax=Roseateles sp. SL47 TaxID=2995138 RepID=UPI00226E6C1C|nr:hypothetical protein [Roseateles sp. SL47]WAC73438.1 hypothetical protein OU995_01420 [Roseateles sp. SL47]
MRPTSIGKTSSSPATGRPDHRPQPWLGAAMVVAAGLVSATLPVTAQAEPEAADVKAAAAPTDSHQLPTVTVTSAKRSESLQTRRRRRLQPDGTGAAHRL